MIVNKLSFLASCAVIVGIFLGVQSFKGQHGQALASSSSGLAGKQIADDVRYSASQKRSIRRVVMKSPDGLMSLTGRDVRAVLNQPELIRTDLPTVVWQYRNEMCVLDVYFTTDKPKALKAPVVHYEVRARHKGLHDEDVRDACVRDLVRTQAAGQSLVKLDALYKAR